MERNDQARLVCKRRFEAQLRKIAKGMSKTELKLPCSGCEENEWTRRELGREKERSQP